MQDRATLLVLIGEFYEKLARLGGLVPRDVRFPDAADKIKVAIGMRRVGKTCLLYQQILKFIENGIDKSAILYINFEDDRLAPLDHQKLAKLVDAFYSIYPENHDRKCYFFFDEIQNVPDWATVIRRFQDTKNVEIFLTGSSAKLLSKEIATSLRGRSLAVEVWPYSFSEYLRAKNVAVERTLFTQKASDLLNQQFRLYLSMGGFPEVIPYDVESRQKTLRDYLDVAIYRDIIERHEVKKPSVIKSMLLSMVHNIGKPFAINKFYNDLKTRGYVIGKDPLYEYADHIEDAYMSFFVPIYDMSMRKRQTNPKKIYSIDPGLVRATTLDYESDLGRLFENIVYLDLRRLGYRVNYYLTTDGYEVDFLATSPFGEQKLFQVVWGMQEKGTKEREERALHAAMKELNSPGELITLETYLEKGFDSYKPK